MDISTAEQTEHNRLLAIIEEQREVIAQLRAENARLQAHIVAWRDVTVELAHWIPATKKLLALAAGEE